MRASSTHRRRVLSRAFVACFVLVAWVGAQAAALAHVACGTCGHHAAPRPTPRAAEPCADAPGGARPAAACACRRGASTGAHGPDGRDSHVGRSRGATRHGSEDDVPAPGDDEHGAGTCAMCVIAGTVTVAPSVAIVLEPAMAGTPRAAVPFVPPSSAPRFEPGLARGPPTLAPS